LQEKAALSREAGADLVVLYNKQDFEAEVKAFTGGRGVPVVYDGVGRSTFEISFDCLERRGMLVGFGNASGPAPPLDPLLLSRKGSLYLTRPTLFDYTFTRQELLTSASALFDVVREGAVKITIGRTWPLAEAAAAHRALESRQTTGSSLLLP
jgi:NADPH2:quinone reductase